MTRKDVKNPVTIWAILSTLAAVGMAAYTAIGVPSCNDVARASDIVNIDSRIEKLVDAIHGLEVVSAQHTVQIQNLIERERERHE